MSIESEYIEKDFEITLESIYRQISIEEQFDIDNNRFESFMEKMIEKCFDKDFLLIETKSLISDVNRLNITFVKLINKCVEHKYKKISLIFIYYCDYFDCDYHLVYSKLHEKLQKIIENDLIKMIGVKRFNHFNQLKNSSTDNKGIVTLFDLIKK